MDFLGQIKETWFYALVVAVVSACAITYSVVEVIIIRTMRKRNAEQTEEIKSLNNILNNLKQQYDIPDSVIADYNKKYTYLPQEIEFENLNVINADLTKSIQTIIKRNVTTQIQYPGFTITISTSTVNPDGETKFNVGYIHPKKEIPESLQFSLHPAQFMTVNSAGNEYHFFYLQLIASDPLSKYAMVNVATFSDLRNILDKTTIG
ncbi:MAG: hypothetical protein Q8L00_01545 [Deltaproteobacteria bacterium]|nr:hypothetical protein [Deltaproteobacteria bacterium]